MGLWVFFFLSVAEAVLLLFLSTKTCYAELITGLPGQPVNVSFKQYSGYIVTDAQQGRALFYYFVQADSADHLSRPLTLWFNGGPGCSSLGYGAFMEHGPFQPAGNGLLSKNKYSWNLESNMLYVESPIGVGFSYSNTSSAYINWNDTLTAEDNLRFIVKWLEEFPEYKDSDLYLTGESYAGHYVPQLAELLVEYNKKPNIRPIKLKAIAIGNPLLDFDISVNAGDYLWAHGLISDETLKLEKTVCNDSRALRESIQGNVSRQCFDVFYRVAEEIGGDIDASDILLPLCLDSSTVDQFQQFNFKGNQALKIHAMLARRNMRSSSGDPCLSDRISPYLNNPQVQRAIHANTTNLPYEWAFCRAGPLRYQINNEETSQIPVLTNLVRSGIPIFIFSGDQDFKIPLTQTRIVVNILVQDLKLLPLSNYGPWYDKEQVGGWGQWFGAEKNGKNVTYITYATVRGAAHEVPFTSPSQALTLFRAFLTGSPLPGPQT